MKTISNIKKDMEFNKSLSALIETLKTIAVSQYRSLEKRIKTFKDFLLTIGSFFELIDIKKSDHPFLIPRGKSQIVVAITSDTGFLGGLNMQVVSTAIRELEKIPGRLIIIGERGKVYVRGIGVTSVNFPGIKDEERHAQAMQLRNYIIENVISGSFGYAKVIYPHPVSFTVQRVETVSLLPYAPSDIKKTQEDIPKDLIMESSPRDIAGYLVYLWMGEKLHEIFGLSRLAEFAARYIHLEESSQKLKDIDKKTRLEYFRVRHELVDRTMRELFAGRSLYAKR